MRRAVSEIPLPWLRASEPIGFLAAIGLLRVCSARPGLGTVTLAWADSPGWPGRLGTSRECNEDQLVKELTDHMRGRHLFGLFSGRTPDGTVIGDKEWDDVKVAPELFRCMLLSCREQSTATSRETVDFLAALGSEMIRLGNKDVVKPSALHMTSGNQAFLETIRELARSLDPGEPLHPKAARPPDAAFRAALFGADADTTGRDAADRFSSLGFDSSREAVYALTAEAPTDTGPRSIRAAVWLAVEAMPLFPCRPCGGRLHTRGFDRRVTAFSWPVWDGPLTVDAVRTAVGLTGGPTDPSGAARWRAYGIRAVMRSNRVTIGQGYGQLRPGVRVV